MKHSIYKRFLRNVLLNLILLTVVYVILFSLQFGPYIQTEYWVRDAYILKRHIAQSIKEKKIVIIAGSNGLFGIDSSHIENTTGIKTVNMSVHAGLSTGFMLDPRKLPLDKGDIALLPLEFEYYRQKRRFNNLTIEAVITWDRKYYENLSPWQKLEFIASCSPLRVAATLFKKYFRRERRDTMPPPRLIAAAEKSWAANDKGFKSHHLYLNINRFGDAVIAKGPPKKIKIRAYGMTNPGWEILPLSKKSISSFVKYCRDREVDVLFTWPSTLKSAKFDLKNKIIRNNLAKIKGFLDNLGVPLLGEPEDFHFQRGFFYDTSYHLTPAGKDIRTRRLAAHLKKWLTLTLTAD